MTKKRAAKKKKPKVGARKKRANVIRVTLTDEELRRLKSKAADGEYGDVARFVKSVVLKSSSAKSKAVGGPGSRTQPNESVPTAAHKATAPPRRGRPSSHNRSTPDVEKGSHDHPSLPEEAFFPSEFSAKFSAEIRALRRWSAENPDADMNARKKQLLRLQVERHATAMLPPELADLCCSFFWESDRALIICAASIAGDRIQRILRHFFKLQSGISDDELDFLFTKRPKPPLESVAIQMRLAFAAGIIDRRLADALLALQSLRSVTAAHKRQQVILKMADVEEISNHLDDVAFQGIKYSLEQDWAKWSQRDLDDEYVPVARRAFMMLVGAIMTFLDNSEKRLTTRSDNQSSDGKSP